MSELVSSAVVFYALHRLLVHVEHDVDGFVIRRLPRAVQLLLRHHGKAPCDAVVDAIVALLLPLVQPRHLSSIASVSSAVEGAPGCEIDVFRPPHAPPRPPPVLIFVHGGIWSLGNRTQYRALGQRLAAEGFVGAGR